MIATIRELEFARFGNPQTCPRCGRDWFGRRPGTDRRYWCATCRTTMTVFTGTCWSGTTYPWRTVNAAMRLAVEADPADPATAGVWHDRLPDSKRTVRHLRRKLAAEMARQTTIYGHRPATVDEFWAGTWRPAPARFDASEYAERVWYSPDSGW